MWMGALVEASENYNVERGAKYDERGSSNGKEETKNASDLCSMKDPRKINVQLTQLFFFL